MKLSLTFVIATVYTVNVDLNQILDVVAQGLSKNLGSNNDPTRIEAAFKARIGTRENRDNF